MTHILLSFFLLFTYSCGTVTISNSKDKLTREPDYQQRKSFFVFGLVRKHYVNVDEVCGDKEVVQMQSQYTALDTFLSIVTIGIYTPRTAKVWCGDTQP